MRIQRQSETFSWRFASSLEYGTPEWEAHRQNVEGILHDLYHRRDAQGRTLDNRRAFGYVSDDGEDYRPTDADRQRMYDQILQIMFETGGPGNYANTSGRGVSVIPRNRSALLMAGIGGAGKGTILKHNTFGPYLGNSDHFIINPDDTKLVMARLGMIPDADELRERYGIEPPPGYENLSPMERSPFVHEEASWLTKKLAGQLQNEGYNVIHDGTLGRPKKVDDLTKELRKMGYDPTNGGRVNLALVDQDVEEGYSRAGYRHWKGNKSFGEFDHPRPDPGGEDVGDQGGRALPRFIHEENNAPPGSTARSAPAHHFPYYQTKTDSSIHFDGFYPLGGNPTILGGHGPDYADIIPPGQMRKMGRRMTASEDEPITVHDIVTAFENSEIDLRTMVSAIAQRVQVVRAQEQEPRGYHDSHVAGSDEVMHWLELALRRGHMTKEEFDAAATALHPVIFGSDSLMPNN